MVDILCNGRIMGYVKIFCATEWDREMPFKICSARNKKFQIFMCEKHAWKFQKEGNERIRAGFRELRENNRVILREIKNE